MPNGMGYAFMVGLTIGAFAGGGLGYMLSGRYWAEYYRGLYMIGRLEQLSREDERQRLGKL